MRPAILFLLAFSAAPLSAQQLPAEGAAPAVKAKALPSGSITGQIVCADTRRPARGALVLLQSLSAKKDGSEGDFSRSMARVGMDGTYQLNHIAAGSYAVVAVLPGYLSPLDTIEASGLNTDSEPQLRKALAAYNSVTVRENTAAREDLVLERGAAVSGRVLYPDGSPASQVNLLLEDVAKKAEGGTPPRSMNLGILMRSMFTHQSTATDDQGHFRLSGVAPGTYRLSAVPVYQGTEGNDNQIMGMMGMVNFPGTLHVYAGDTLHRKDAKTFTVRGGEEVGELQITLPINSFHMVSGQVTAKDGRPISLAAMKLTDSSDDTLTFQTDLGENGTFRFLSVPPGTWLLTASDGKITNPDPNLPVFMARRMGTPVAAFADGSTPVLVKDSDVTDVALALEETALKPVPKNAAAPEQEP